ncbi:MAG: cytidine deaminase [Balneolaceae bacterium]|nr:cytidine deaminase [Balneolaceae bacterium]
MKNQNQPGLKSYSPYSKTEESCFIEGDSGLIYSGVRIENISFPLTISAVQAAVCSCLANGDKPVKLFQQKPFSDLSDYWKKLFGLELNRNCPPYGHFFNPIISSPDDIKKALNDLCRKAVTIHSGFPVSALLFTSEGWVAGVNVEVASWSLGLCAERVAIARAISSGYSRFKELHVYAPKSDFCSPCGACRQVMNECMPGKKVVLHHQNQTLTRHFTEHLLPYGFSSDILKNT